MRTRLVTIATTVVALGALTTPALADPPDPVMPLPTETIEACGTTLLIEDAGVKARERFSETETGFQVHSHGNLRVRVTDLETGESIVIQAPGSAKVRGSFNPDTGEFNVMYDLSGQTLLLPEPYTSAAEVAAQVEFGLPEFGIVYGKFVGNVTYAPDGTITASVTKAGNRVVDVCDLI